MFANSYENKRVLVTGHTGFKGSWLSAWLIALGARSAGFSLAVPTEPSHFECLSLHSKMRDYRGDIRDYEAFRKCVDDFKPEIIFHLAAQALVKKSYADPVSTFETNMLGTMNVMETVRFCPSVQAVIVITSDKCYRNNEWVWGYRETDYLGGADPYSASKGCAEIIAQSYFKSFFYNHPACATVRAGNVIGGGDWALDRIVPDCAKAWKAGIPVNIRSPWATRPWQHVLEPLSGYLWLGACLINNDLAATGYDPKGQAYNFGPPADVNNNVAELVCELAKYWPGFRYEIEKKDHAGHKESTLLKLCCDKALAELRWKAVLNFSETVGFTAEWYKIFHSQKHVSPQMWTITQTQIDDYCMRARERGLVWSREKGVVL